MSRPEHWTNENLPKAWLINAKATLLASYKGWDFWEHPEFGDEAPVLATKQGAGLNGWVWNTQDFDLPHKDDL